MSESSQSQHSLLQLSTQKVTSSVSISYGEEGQFYEALKLLGGWFRGLLSHIVWLIYPLLREEEGFGKKEERGEKRVCGGRASKEGWKETRRWLAGGFWWTRRNQNQYFLLLDSVAIQSVGNEMFCFCVSVFLSRLLFIYLLIYNLS